MSSLTLLIGIGAVALQLHGGTPKEYAFKQVEQGGFSRQREAKIFVLRSADDYDAYNKKLGREVEKPKIDWKKNQILAIHIGPAPTTGYDAAVKRIVKTGPNSVDVEVIRTGPGGHAMVAMHVTYPFVLVSTPRFTQTPKLHVSVVQPKDGGQTPPPPPSSD